MNPSPTNPWQNLGEGEAILPEDMDRIRRFNDTASPDKQIRFDVLPEPFIGRRDAPVVLLNLNPGFADDNVATHQQEYFRSSLRRNLLHQQQEYPFYYLDPNIDPGNPNGGKKWWRQCLKPVLEAVGDDKLAANRLLCIEFFPYHSRKYAHHRWDLFSQEYSFQLADAAVERGAIIICMRAKRPWLEAVPKLDGYPKRYDLNSWQNVTISRGNCPDGFNHVVKAIQAGQ